MKSPEIPEVSELVRGWMPDADEAELKQATVNLRRYLATSYRIAIRLEAEDSENLEPDNSPRRVIVENQSGTL